MCLCACVWLRAQSLSRVWLFSTPWTIAHYSSSVIGILQTRRLEWVAISYSRGSSWHRGRIHISCIGRQILYRCVTWETFSVWVLKLCPKSMSSDSDNPSSQRSLDPPLSLITHSISAKAASCCLPRWSAQQTLWGEPPSNPHPHPMQVQSYYRSTHSHWCDLWDLTESSFAGRPLGYLETLIPFLGSIRTQAGAQGLAKGPVELREGTDVEEVIGTQNCWGDT